MLRKLARAVEARVEEFQLKKILKEAAVEKDLGFRGTQLLHSCCSVLRTQPVGLTKGKVIASLWIMLLITFLSSNPT